MSKVILTKGLPASGKSTWAKQYLKENTNAVRTNKDELRAMLHEGVWSKEKEWFVVHVRDFIINQAMKDGHDVVVDDTNLHPKHENHIRELVLGYNTQNNNSVAFEIKEFLDISLEECIKRDQNRENKVGSKAIQQMYNQFLKPITTPIFKQDKNLPWAIISDLDGTLANLNGRDAYNASTCENDLVNDVVADILSLYKKRGDAIVLVSGRDSQWKPQTEAWLKKNNILYDHLFMRPIKDARKDSIIKQEIYDNNIKDKYNVGFVLDDRDQVIAFWRGLGLTCLQVNYGNF